MLKCCRKLLLLDREDSVDWKTEDPEINILICFYISEIYILTIFNRTDSLTFQISVHNGRQGANSVRLARGSVEASCTSTAVWPSVGCHGSSETGKKCFSRLEIISLKMTTQWLIWISAVPTGSGKTLPQLATILTMQGICDSYKKPTCNSCN